MYCPITGGLCEHRRPRLRTCFLKKYTESFGRDSKVEYLCNELAKYVSRGAYTIVDLARTVKELSQEVRDEAFQGIYEYVKTLPCNLILTQIAAERLLKPSQDFIESSKLVYLSQSSTLTKRIIRDLIFYLDFVTNRILTELLELVISMVDLQLTSTSTMLKHLMPCFRLYYMFNNLVSVPLYMLYLRHRKDTTMFKTTLEELSEELSQLLPSLEKELLYLNFKNMNHEDSLVTLLLQINNSINKFLEEDKVKILKKLRENARLYYILRKELFQINIDSMVMEIFRKFDPEMLESPFNIYLLLSLVLEEKYLIKLARDQICRQYINEEHTYTFRMYFPVNAALDDLLSDLTIELYLSRQDMFLNALGGDKALLLLNYNYGLKGVVLIPSRKIVTYSLQNLLFLHSAFLDLLTWSMNLNFDELWNMIIDSVNDDRVRALLLHCREYLLNTLDTVTDALYIVTYSFYMRKEFEELFNRHVDRLFSLCKGEY